MDLKSALQEDPGNGPMRFHLGKLYNEVFDTASAVKELVRAKDSGLVEGGRVSVELARAYVAEGRLEEVLAQIQPMEAFEPEALATIHALRGRSSFALGRAEDAERSLAAARKIQADLPDAALLAAQMSAGRGNLSDALRHVDTVLERQATNFSALNYRAELLRASGKTDEALAAYEHVLKLHPNHFRALTNRSSLLIGLGRLDEAEKNIANLSRAYKGHPQVFIQTGLLHLARGKPREALEAAQVARKAEPEPVQALLLAGFAHQALGQHLQAELVLNLYLKRLPRSPLGRRALAETMIKLNKADRALELLAPMLRDGSTDAVAHALAGEANVRVKKYDKALEYYERAVKLAPDADPVRIRQAVIRISHGDTQHGIRDLAEVLGTQADATKWHEVLVLTLLGRKDVEGAAKAVDALEKQPAAAANPITANLRGLVMLAKGDKQAAIQSFQDALKRDPAFFPAAKNLAQLDLGAGNAEAAMQRYMGVLAADASNLKALLAQADLNHRLGKARETQAILEKATKAHPASVEARMRLAGLYLASGDKSKALEAAEHGLVTNPDEPQALTLAGTIQLQTGNTNRATQTLSRLVQLMPESESARIQLAQAQILDGRRSEAEASIRKALSLRPGDPVAQSALASLLVTEKRVDDALRFAREVHRSNPRSPAGLIMEAEILERAGKYPDAASAYRGALKIAGSGEIAVRVYRAARKAGSESAAATELREWLSKNNDPKARKVLAYLFIEKKEYQAAAEAYALILKQAANDAEALNGLAWTYMMLQDNRALDLAKKAHDLYPDSYVALDTLGWMLFQKGQLAQSMPLIKKAATLAPQNLEVRYHLAAVLAQAGEHANAKKILVELLTTQPSFPGDGDAKELLRRL